MMDADLKRLIVEPEIGWIEHGLVNLHRSLAKIGSPEDLTVFHEMYSGVAAAMYRFKEHFGLLLQAEQMEKDSE